MLRRVCREVYVKGNVALFAEDVYLIILAL